MDRSTEITIRSAIIIACMIFVPLWAVMGTSWTVVLSKDHVAEAKPTVPSRTTKAAVEPRREPSKTGDLPTVDPALPQTIEPPPMVVTQAPPPNMTPPVAAPPANAPPPMQTPRPVVPQPAPVVTVATPAPPQQNQVAVAPPVQPVIEIRSSGTPVTTAAPIAPSIASRIASENLATLPQVSITSMTATGNETTRVLPVSAAQTQQSPQTEVTPAPVSAGDWFQWTETRLRNLGATQFILESAGDMGGYRFRCKAPLPNDPGFTRHFEATGASALEAMQDALRQIDAWRIGVR